MNSVLISKNGLNKMLIIERVYEAHTEPARISMWGFKTEEPAFDEADNVLAEGSFLGHLPGLTIRLQSETEWLVIVAISVITFYTFHLQFVIFTSISCTVQKKFPTDSFLGENYTPQLYIYILIYVYFGKAFHSRKIVPNRELQKDS